MKHWKTLWISLSLLTALSSCGGEDEPRPDLGYNYLPLAQGNSYTYEVDSVVFDEFNERIDSFRFTLRDEYVEVIEDLEGRAALRVERYKRFTDTADFRFQYAYTVTMDRVRAERKVNNQTEVFFVFPPREDDDWDANAFNSKDEQTYYYLSVDASDEVSGMGFDSVTTVIQQEDTAIFIFRSYAEERFARNVGLIYREFFDIETQQNVDSGLHWIQRLSDYQIVQ